jgi:Zn-dependent protease with chaperone function
MSDARRDFTRIGFAKTFLLPALLIFLVPVVSLAFFWHAQSLFNSRARESVLAQIRADANLSAEERADATAFFSENPFSELVKNKEFAANLDSTYRFYFATFRWMIRLSALSIVVGLAVFFLVGLCVLLSMRSQQAQYLSLSTGWHALRIYGAFQALIQGILLVALSFWVTALWFEFYSVKLVILAGILAFAGVAAVIAGIFKRTDTTQVVEGTVIDKDAARPLWNELGRICDKVGAARPDQVIVGIDDNFFVTEMPVTVDGKIHNHRTLYVSLSLLKQMSGTEADAVLAHEMAHFSGNDTLFSKKISPLLVRYGAYLQALYEGGITRPIFYFMHGFRAMYELSLSKLSREREFRADRIAADATSPRDFAGALLRIAAYSKFRNGVQQELFKQEQVLPSANISQLIDRGFHAYAASFASSSDLGELETSHPFDTHPPVAERLSAIGISMNSQQVEDLLATPGNGRWYQNIDDADEIEQRMWGEFENRFRSFHEQTLAYRFLPETDEEREIVAKAFPQMTVDGKDGSLILDHESINFTAWSQAIHFGEITQVALDENGVLVVHYNRDGKQKEKVKMKTFGTRQQEALDAMNRYYSRYLHAVAYQTQKNQEAGVANE